MSTILLRPAGRAAVAIAVGAAIIATMVAAHAAGLLSADASLLAIGFIGAVGIMGLLVLSSPLAALLVTLVATFLWSAVPVSPSLAMLAMAGLVLAMVLAVGRRVNRWPAVGVVEALMALYVSWNALSAIAPHPYSPRAEIASADFSVWRFILTGTILPFALYYAGRFVAQDPERSGRRAGRSATMSGMRVVNPVVWTILGVSGYSALVSILQFTGPTALIWPRYIANDSIWIGRAAGLVRQPVGNGAILITGFVVAMYVLTNRARPVWQRAIGTSVAAACIVGVYLTHTRAVWLGFGIVLLIGLAGARYGRRLYAVLAVALVLTIALNWSTFASSDREAGGVTSEREIDDRLNGIATSIWAIGQEPIQGWGIATFPEVNTRHHMQWSQDTPWIQGFGINSHENELGITAELGFVGLALWLGILVNIGVRMRRAVAALRGEEREFALVAVLAVIVWVIAGFTVDLRFLDMPNALAAVMAGLAVGLGERAQRVRSPATVMVTV